MVSAIVMPVRQRGLVVADLAAAVLLVWSRAKPLTALDVRRSTAAKQDVAITRIWAKAEAVWTAGEVGANVYTTANAKRSQRKIVLRGRRGSISSSRSMCAMG